MQLLILIVINIALGTVFYLVISLKLEKSASEYREKKFRREMDEVIREFNNTAERNISLLENKINIMKKILRESGQLSSLDITLGDEKKDSTSGQHVSTGKEQMEDDVPSDKRDKKLTYSMEPVSGEHQKSFSDIANEAWNSIKSIMGSVKGKELTSADRGDFMEKPRKNETEVLKKGNSLDITIEKDFTSLNLPTGVESVIDKKEEWTDLDVSNTNDVHLEEMFMSAEDKYGLVADLYKQGYPLDILARSSGIPLGELKLILNLSSSL